MAKERRAGAMLLALLILSAHVVPYTLLSGVKAWYGSFLYWTLFAVASIAVIAWITAPWAGREGRDRP